MYKGVNEVIFVFQVAPAVVFATMEWMDKTERGVKDSFMEGRVAQLVVVLEGEVVEIITEIRKPTRLVEVVEGTQGGAEGAMKMILVEEEEDHITMEKISKMNAVIIQLGMAS